MDFPFFRALNPFLFLEKVFWQNWDNWDCSYDSTNYQENPPLPHNLKIPICSGKHVMQGVGRCTSFFVKIKTTAVPFVINKKTM